MRIKTTDIKVGYTITTAIGETLHSTHDLSVEQVEVIIRDNDRGLTADPAVGDSCLMHWLSFRCNPTLAGGSDIESGLGLIPSLALPRRS